MKWFFGLVATVLLVLLCVYGYNQYRAKKNLDDGAVTGTGLMTPAEKARFDAEDHGDTPDGNSERKHESAQQSAADIAANPAGFPNSGNAVTNQPSTNGSITGAPSALGSAPVSDTIKPNPTNGMVFAGTGQYQWYRQGNLTWRVNTSTGSSCIVYATMEEWRKEVVMNHGCGGNA